MQVSLLMSPGLEMWFGEMIDWYDEEDWPDDWASPFCFSQMKARIF